MVVKNLAFTNYHFPLIYHCFIYTLSEMSKCLNVQINGNWKMLNGS